MMVEAQIKKPKVRQMLRTGCSAACRVKTVEIISTAPVRKSPPMMMNIKAMVQGAEFDSTAPASLTGSRPSTIMTAAVPMATTSGGCFSRMNSTNMMVTITSIATAALVPVN